MHNLFLDRLLEDVDLGGGKLAGRDALLKEHVELGKGASAGLGDAEVGVDDAAEAKASPEEGGEVVPVPFAFVEHVRRQDSSDDANNVVQVAAQDDRLDLETARRQLAHERVADSADGELVEERPDNHKAACGNGALVVVDKTKEAEDKEHAKEAAETIQVEIAAADAVGHEGPCAKDANHVDAVLTEGEAVGLLGSQAGLAEEVGRVVGEGVAREVLDGPDHADDLCAAQVDALEAV